MAFALLDHTEEKTTIDEILTGTFREKDRQINFAINELEKTKEELLEYSRYTAGNDLVVDWENIEEVFKDRIAELKGENK